MDVPSTCQHERLKARAGHAETMTVVCMLCRRYVVMEVDNQGYVDMERARARITATWAIRDQLSGR